MSEVVHPTTFAELLRVLSAQPEYVESLLSVLRRSTPTFWYRERHRQLFDEHAKLNPPAYVDIAEFDSDTTRRMLVGIPGLGISESSRTLQEAETRLRTGKAFLEISPLRPNPLVLLGLIHRQAFEISVGGDVLAARTEILRSLGLDEDLLDWKREQVFQILDGAGLPPRFEGLCQLDSSDDLIRAICYGLSLDQEICRVVQDVEPDPFVLHYVLNEKRPIAKFEIGIFS